MLRPRHFLSFLLAMVVVGQALGLWLLWPRMTITAITWENAARIQEGMTVAEVEAILGGPATGQPTSRSWVTFPDPTGWTSRRNSDMDQKVWWCTHEIHVGVTVNADGRITSCHSWTVRDESSLEALRRRFGL
jgi:hypothetical protein